MLSGLLSVATSRLVLFVCGEQILGIAGDSDLPQRVDRFHAFSQSLFQTVAEALAGLPRASQLDGQLLAGGRLRLRVWDAVPGGDGEGEHGALAVQSLDPPDGAQRQREAIAGRPCAMRLAREAAGGARAGCVDEAGRLGGKAEVLLA